MPFPAVTFLINQPIGYGKEYYGRHGKFLKKVADFYSPLARFVGFAYYCRLFGRGSYRAVLPLSGYGNEVHYETGYTPRLQRNQGNL